MINRTVLVGRLTKDPELKQTTSGIANVRFTVAVNRPFSNQQGERQADFINCIAWRAQAENMARFLKKGSLVGIDGRIQTGSFQGQDGQMRYTTEVVADSIQFLEPRSATSGGGASAGAGFNQQPTYDDFPSPSAPADNPFPSQSQGQASMPTIDISDDDLPF